MGQMRVHLQTILRQQIKICHHLQIPFLRQGLGPISSESAKVQSNTGLRRRHGRQRRHPAINVEDAATYTHGYLWRATAYTLCPMLMRGERGARNRWVVKRFTPSPEVHRSRPFSAPIPIRSTFLLNQKTSNKE